MANEKEVQPPAPGEIAPTSQPRIVLPRLGDWARAIRNAVRDLRRSKK